MPRRIVTRRAVGLSDFTLNEKLSFLSGWTPDNPPHRGRWNSMAAYLSDFSAVRAELVARFRVVPAVRDKVIFGDLALAYREKHGAEALERASYVEIRYGQQELIDETK
jgi:hypothetical protein